MPSYNLQEILSSATAAIGRRDDISLSDASRLANDAYFEVAYALGPEELEKVAYSSTTSSKYRVELPNDFYAPISAKIIYRPSWSTSSSVMSSYNTLHITSYEALDGRNPEPGGVPEEIAFYNSWMELYPSPNSGYSFHLRYHAHPSDMTNLTDIPSVSTPWRKAIELKTREYLADFVGDGAASQNAQAQYLRYVTTLKTPTGLRQSGEWRQGFKPFVSQGGRRKV